MLVELLKEKEGLKKLAITFPLMKFSRRRISSALQISSFGENSSATVDRTLTSREDSSGNGAFSVDTTVPKQLG